MKLSKLIEELISIKKEKGDVNLCYQYQDHGSSELVSIGRVSLQEVTHEYHFTRRQKLATPKYYLSMTY
jgi:hypothetical protein